MSKLHFTAIALVLAMATSVHAQTYKVLYNFGSNPGDPRYPEAGTISQGPDGSLYCTALDYGSRDGGSAFKISVGGTLTVLVYFNPVPGQDPSGGLTLATDLQFYGTTNSGGLYNHGTIFRIAPDGKVTSLYSFTGGADSNSPRSAPIQSVAGYFYGTTAGVPVNWGSIYKVTNHGDFTLLHTFVDSSQGAAPMAPLIQGSDYGFYGSAAYGGALGQGNIFRISSQGYFKVLHDFDGENGSRPYGPLIQATDGNYYGVASGGGSADAGVVFKVNPNSAYSVLHEFSGGVDGAQAYGGLVEASDGNFYGTNDRGGANGWGVIFRITPSGVFTVLHDFDMNSGVSSLTLIQHTNGILYGDTTFGGTAGDGVFYSLDLGLPPFITYLTVYGRVGAHVVILGQHFTNGSVVSFNGVPAQILEIQPTYIKAIVPDGATTGPITVTTTTGTLKSNKIFVIH